MSQKRKRPSVIEKLRELLEQLGPLLKPGKLKPVPIPTPTRRKK